MLECKPAGARKWQLKNDLGKSREGGNNREIASHIPVQR
jgi:hypothetical protein